MGPTKEQRRKHINRVTYWGVLVNVLLSAAKLIGGVIGQSQALIADGLHSLSDLASDAMVLVAAHHAGEEADDDHPYGHARFETIATMALATLLGAVGVSIAYDAITRLIADESVAVPALFTLWIAAISILSKEVLYHYTRIVGHRIRSQLLLANAWHHRSDAVSSIVVFIGIAGAQLEMPKLDAYAAIIVAIMIIKIGFELGYNSIQELADKGLDPEKIEKIRNVILAHEDVRHLHMLRTRRMGHSALVDVHIEVAPKLSVSEGHHISEKVEKALIDRFDEINDVTVHIDPENDETIAASIDLPLRSELVDELTRLWSNMPELVDVDDITLHYLGGKISVEASMPLRHAEAFEHAQELQRKFREACMKIESIGQATLRFH
jgi:cation diffusion facilitator family transporter